MTYLSIAMIGSMQRRKQDQLTMNLLFKNLGGLFLKKITIELSFEMRLLQTELLWKLSFVLGRVKRTQMDLWSLLSILFCSGFTCVLHVLQYITNRLKNDR